MSADDDRAELLRRFEAAIKGAGFDDLRQLAGNLSSLGAQLGREAATPSRPELRRRKLGEPTTFTVRVDLRGSKPPIWRRLELRSDLSLNVVHRVLQHAFGWTDTHLWRFSLGGDPFDRASQVFLCPWDVEEGELEDEGGVPAGEVRLDETVQERGDVLSYAYDYGDGWELRLRVEAVRSASADAPSATVVDGRRAAPPEDCGGIRNGDDLAEVLDDPARFDLDEINEALRSPFMVLTESGLDRRLIDLIGRLAWGSVSDGLTQRALALIPDQGRPDEQDLRRSVRAFTWFLDRAADGGMPLTAAGYLMPSDVEAVARVLPAMGDWIGRGNRESDTMPVLHFRKLLQSLGLLRKYKGTLRLTRAGAAVQQVREELWDFLADELGSADEGFDTDATLLLLVYAATSAGAELPLDEIAGALADLGWRTGAGQPVDRSDLYWLQALEILSNVSSEQVGWLERWRIDPVAGSLAAAALRRH